MTASPVFKALVAGRLAQLNLAEASITEEVTKTLGAPPPDTHRPEAFIRFCEAEGLPWRPGAPATIAKFVLQFAKLGNVVEEVRAISASHYSQNLPDPCATWMVSQALCRLTKIEPPRSWPNAEKVVFMTLPEELQCFLIPREKDRDTAVRRAQNEAGDLRARIKELEAAAPKQPTTEQVKNEASTHATSANA